MEPVPPPSELTRLLKAAVQASRFLYPDPRNVTEESVKRWLSEMSNEQAYDFWKSDRQTACDLCVMARYPIAAFKQKVETHEFHLQRFAAHQKTVS